MFTIKFYSSDGFRQIIREAESFTILRSENGEAEITIHQKNMGEDSRIDIRDDSQGVRPCVYSPPCFGKAIIENSAGRTTEIIALRPGPAQMPKAA